MVFSYMIEYTNGSQVLPLLGGIRLSKGWLLLVSKEYVKR
jgi:hypothetical protein